MEPEQLRPEAIGARLSLIRRAHGLRSSEIADLLDIDRTNWSRFENGQRAIPHEKAYLLAQKFKLTFDFIYLGRWGGLTVDVAERLRTAENSSLNS